MSNNIAREFACKCGVKGWITEDRKTSPCPSCGRVYLGVYDPDKFTIEGKDITDEPVFVTHSDIDKDELKIFMDNVGSKVVKEVEYAYHKDGTLLIPDQESDLKEV